MQTERVSDEDRSTQRAATRAEPYPDNAAHLLDELRRLDVLLEQRIAAYRTSRPLVEGLAASKGLFISDAEVDALLRRDHMPESPKQSADEKSRGLARLEASIAERVAASQRCGVYLALPHLADCFELSPPELAAVVICLAPELDTKYDTLYAYMQDDITRRRPSVDLVLNILCTTPVERWQTRPVLAPQSALLRNQILCVNDDPRSPSGSSGLAQFLRLNQRTLGHILGDNRIDSRLDGIVRLAQPSAGFDRSFVESQVKIELGNVVQRYSATDTSGTRLRLIQLHGPAGVGKRNLALGVCYELGLWMLDIDVGGLLRRMDEATTYLRLAARESWLQPSALYLSTSDLDELAHDPLKWRSLWRAIAEVAADNDCLLFVSSEKPCSLTAFFDPQSLCSIELPVPSVPVRRLAWQSTLEESALETEPAWSLQLAEQFRLTPTQIREAVGWAVQRRAITAPQEPLALAELYAAARQGSQVKLSELAVKVEPHYGWDDLILPADTHALLREICAQARNRHRVFSEWGFDRKLKHGTGLSALFAGPSGTGKTMAAEVLAGDLQLDLYKIDLSGVVSKYIGETEKNLSRIFAEGEASNAILLFDEADALFGKRTRVTDAHDRYANIETSYLLQKMEAYEGIVILATNLRDNMDQAFARRIRFLVEFPVPDAASRREIWRTHFPPQAPLSDAVDFDWLSERFQITGGNIKNITLNAAFLAAHENVTIAMTHVMHGARREFEKIGKVWTEPVAGDE